MSSHPSDVLLIGGCFVSRCLLVIVWESSLRGGDILKINFDRQKAYEYEYASHARTYESRKYAKENSFEDNPGSPEISETAISLDG